MKRDKKWWKGLTKKERCELVALETADKFSNSSMYLPDDTVECGYCTTPHMFGGLCPRCNNKLLKIIEKADNKKNLIR